MFRGAHEHGFRGDGGELSFVEVGDANSVFVLNDGDDGGIAQHALFVFWLQDFDEFVSDAAEAAGKDDALGVGSRGQILGRGDADKRRGVFADGSPV